MKESADLGSVSKIHELLIPFEYTRLDKIIEIAFTVAEDATSAAELEQTAEVDAMQDAQTEASNKIGANGAQPLYSPTPSNVLGEIRERIVSQLSATYSPFVKKSRALYWTADKSARAAITISKEYARGDFWYAYHDGWDSFLSEGSVKLFLFGCVGRDYAFAIPFEWIHQKIGFLYATERKGGSHFHVHLFPGEGGELSLRLNNGKNESIQRFTMPLSASSLGPLSGASGSHAVNAKFPVHKSRS